MDLTMHMETFFKSASTIDELDWYDISCDILSIDFILNYAAWINWSECLHTNKLSLDIINKCKSHIFMGDAAYSLCKNQKLSLEFINENIEHIEPQYAVAFMPTILDDEFLNAHIGRYDIKSLIRSRQLSDSFIDLNYDAHIMDFELLASNQSLSNYIVMKYMDFKKRSHFDAIVSGYTILSDDILDANARNMDFNKYAKSRQLSKAIIEKHVDILNISSIEIYQKLDETFIRKHKDKFNWANISQYQKLSESFIVEFASIVRWDKIVEFQSISDDFKNSNKRYIDKFIIFSKV